MGNIKRKLSKKSSNNKPKHRDDADFESAVSKRPRCMTHESDTGTVTRKVGTHGVGSLTLDNTTAIPPARYRTVPSRTPQHGYIASHCSWKISFSFNAKWAMRQCHMGFS